MGLELLHQPVKTLLHLFLVSNYVSCKAQRICQGLESLCLLAYHQFQDFELYQIEDPSSDFRTRNETLFGQCDKRANLERSGADISAWNRKSFVSKFHPHHSNSGDFAVRT